MSYILEALKKSQQERELGQVPGLQAMALEEPAAPARPHLWVLMALLLALVAVGIALYAALRPGTGTDAATAGLAAAKAPAPAAEVPEGPPGQMPGPVAPSPVATDTGPGDADLVDEVDEVMNEQLALEEAELARAAAATLADRQQAPAGPAEASSPPETDAPPDAAAAEDPGVEPEVLVVPAPPKPGEHLPRGADELRRAALGDTAAPAPLAAATPAGPPPAFEYTPVPADLIADIEAFKSRVAKVEPSAAAAARPREPAPAKPQASKADSAPEEAGRSPLPPEADAALRGRMPPFSMTVHIYDPERGRRFVYINGRKLRERDESPVGIRVERIVADGAILSYDGERFFQPR